MGSDENNPFGTDAEARIMRSRRLLTCLALLLTVGCGGSDDHTERMAEEHKDDSPVASPAAKAEPAVPVEVERVQYAELDGVKVTGVLARPVGTKGTPGVIVIHEWWGLNENIERMTRQIAGEGYTALAVDLYGGEVAADRDAARELMKRARTNPKSLRKNLRQAHRYLEKQQGAPKVGSIGWCFGGGWSLQTALMLPNKLDGAVIYYGRVVTKRERLAPLTTPILGHFGSEDKGIPIADVRELESLLQELGKEASIHVYEGANHAFANPSGNRYDAEAAEQAWQRTLAFFAETLGE